MDTTALLTDAFTRVRETVHDAIDGLDADQLALRVDDEANPVAWLVWHLARVQDDHVADVAGSEQVWLDEGWAHRFDLPFDRRSIGYGHSSAEVAAVRVDSPALLTDYHDAVHARTLRYLATLGPDDLDRVVSPDADPPVTLGVRLVSVLNDDTQHAGQAAYVAGIARRRS